MNIWAETLPFPHWVFIRHDLFTLALFRDNRGPVFGVSLLYGLGLRNSAGQVFPAEFMLLLSTPLEFE